MIKLARRFSLEAAVKPQIDRRQVEREVDHVRSRFQESMEDLSISTETGGIAGAGAVPDSGGGIGTATTAAAGARAGSSIAGAGSTTAAGGGLIGGAAKKAIPVALAGATAFSISQGIRRLAEASPYLKAQASQFSTAMDVALQPLGKLLANKMDPFIDKTTKMATNFNQLADKSGLSVALSQSLGPESQQGFFRGVGETVRAGFDSIMKDVAMALHSNGGFTGILLSAAKQGARNLNAFIDGLTGVNIGSTIENMAADIKNSWPGWPDLKNQWPGWSNIVTGVDLAEFVNPLNIADMIDIPSWMKDPSFDPGDFDPRDPSPPTFGGGGGSGGLPDPDDPPPTGGGKPGGGGGSDPVFGSPGEADDRADRIDDDGPAIGLDTGGAIDSGGMARVHSGERVLPEAQVSDRGEADLAQGDEIVRTLRQIRRDIRQLKGDSGGRDDAIVDRLDRLLRKMDQGGAAAVSEDDVIAALAKLFDRGGGRNPLNR